MFAVFTEAYINAISGCKTTSFVNLTFTSASEGTLTAEQLALQLLRLTETQSGQLLAQTVVALA
jgi:hypothetical protein